MGYYNDFRSEYVEAFGVKLKSILRAGCFSCFAKGSVLVSKMNAQAHTLYYTYTSGFYIYCINMRRIRLSFHVRYDIASLTFKLY